MIGIDTNVLLRLLVKDDLQQSDIARSHFMRRPAGEPIYLSIVVVVETCWALRRVYGYGNEPIFRAFRALLETDHVIFEDTQIIAQLFLSEAVSSDIPDHLISMLAREAGCRHTVTFDRAATDAVPGMELLS